MATKTANAEASDQSAGPSIYLRELESDLANADIVTLGELTFGERTVEVLPGRNSLWVIVRRAGMGGLALRAVFLMCPYDAKVTRKDAAELYIRIDSELGRHEVVVEAASLDLYRMRMCVRFTPSAPVTIPYQPRDLFPLDAKDNPRGAKGVIEAAQRGINSG